MNNKPVSRIRFAVRIDTDSQIMTVGAARYELASLLENIASQLQGGSKGGILRDHEAKKVGSWQFDYEVGNAKREQRS